MRTLIRGGTLVLPHGEMQADLLIDGETIAQIAPALCAADAEVIDAAGCLVLPGAIDPHTHLDLPTGGTVTADDFDSGTRAALLGGTTALIDFATQDRGGTLRQAYDAWYGRMEGRAHCDVGFHMAITDWNGRTAAEIGGMAALGITSFKLYMAYPALMLQDGGLYAAIRRIGEAGGITGVHCENGPLVECLRAELLARGETGPAAHPLSRPPAVEAEAINRLLTIAQLTGARVNIVHLSSAAGLDTVRAWRAKGLRAYVETCPQYLLLDDALYARGDGAKYVCSPPLRRAADRAALWEAVAGGEVDTIATDHCPFRYADQKRGAADFTAIPNGLPGVEHRLALMMETGVNAGRISVRTLVRLLCENPARQYGLYPGKGALQTGSDADIVLWDTAGETRITAATQAQRVDYTPYEGMRVRGAVRDVWLRGHHAVRDGKMALSGLGAYLRRGRPFGG